MAGERGGILKRLVAALALALPFGMGMSSRAGEDDNAQVIKRVETIQSATGEQGVNAISQRGALITLDVT